MFTCVCSIALSLMSCVFSWQSSANLSKWARSSVLISALWTSSFTFDSEYESKLNWNSCVSSYPTRATKLWRSSSLSPSLSDLVSLKHTRDFSFFYCLTLQAFLSISLWHIRTRRLRIEAIRLMLLNLSTIATFFFFNSLNHLLKFLAIRLKLSSIRVTLSSSFDLALIRLLQVLNFKDTRELIKFHIINVNTMFKTAL